MKRSKKYDFIITGLGIAGALLSFFLLKKNKKILVFDNRENSSSQVAAGIINPITGQRMVKTWYADELFPIAEKTYKEMEDFLGIKIIQKVNILRVLNSMFEQNEWLTKSSDPLNAMYMKNKITLFNDIMINAPFGFGEVTYSSVINFKHIIKGMREKLLTMGCLVGEKINYNQIKIDEVVTVMNFTAKKIIFCEGVGATENPFFNYLPFIPSKGEILTIKCDELNLESIVSKGIFILPLGNKLFKVGSTFDWDDKNPLPTEKAKKELVSKLNGLLKLPYKIMEHEAGIRPSVRDRRPFVGVHPKYAQFYILNGLGTKGALLAPYFANQLVEHIDNGKPLHIEADIKRFDKLRNKAKNNS